MLKIDQGFTDATSLRAKQGACMQHVDGVIDWGDRFLKKTFPEERRALCHEAAIHITLQINACAQGDWTLAYSHGLNVQRLAGTLMDMTEPKQRAP